MPVARQNVGSLPMNLVATRDGRYAIASDMGFRQALWTIRTRDGRGVSHLDFNKGSGSEKTNGLYYGLAVSTDGAVYAAQGGHAAIAVLQIDENGQLRRDGEIATKKRDFPAGLAIDDRGFLYVTSNDPAPGAAVDATIDTPGAVIVYNTRTREEVGRYEFETGSVVTTNYPLAIAVTHDGTRLFVASQRDGLVHVFDASDPKSLKHMAEIATGSHPSSLLLNRDQSMLYVANASSDTITFVDVASMSAKKTVLLRPAIASTLAGASPVGLALSQDEEMLYAALGDMNAVAVIETEDAELLGYVSAGWYPSAVVATEDKLLVANAKGSQVLNPNPRAGATQPTKQQSPLNLLEGDVITMDVPRKKSLPESTEEVLELARLTPRYLKRENPLAHLGIRHVIYVVKENRTYDHVLGDLLQGNGDPSRCIFGRAVTPNQHALAERFVLLDNFYDCGEVSGDGWVWSTQAQANEYVIKNVPYQYSNRGRMFDYEGVNNGYPTGGFPAKGPDGEPMSEHPNLVNGAPEIPDVAEAPGGHLWDMATRQGIGFRNYGFFVGGGESRKGMKILPDNYPSSKGLQPGGHDLEGLTDVDFRRFDLNYADSDAPAVFAEQTGDESFLRPLKTFGKHGAKSRFAEWKIEFDQMLAKAPDGSAVPQLMFIRLGDDHTVGLNGGKHTPRSMVADNDYAVGQLVEAVSQSPIWKETAIFIIEDDAQNGPDHVDAHRSTCYVISPWVTRGSVDHSFHNTVSCIRTMELLIGLNPMNQYDASADPMMFWDTAARNVEPFKAILPDPSILKEKNPEANPTIKASPEQSAMLDLIRESERMNFAVADHAPADRLNQLIWKSVHGANAEQPPTPRGPGVLNKATAEEDDDD